MRYKIKELRESAGMSQEELAKAAGVSRGILSRIECAEDGVTTTTETLQKIAEVLGVKVSALFFEESV